MHEIKCLDNMEDKMLLFYFYNAKSTRYVSMSSRKWIVSKTQIMIFTTHESGWGHCFNLVKGYVSTNSL